MGELISQVCFQGYIPPILLYSISAEDRSTLEGNHDYEVVDGQHRLTTLWHFYRSEPVVCPGGKQILISLPYKEIDGAVTHLFYKETQHTLEWVREKGLKHAYMTPREKNMFDDFPLNLQVITSPQTLDQRRQLFIALQRGKPVRGSDLYKNKTEIPLVRFISEQDNWETRFKTILREHCSVHPDNYWLHWVSRCYLMQTASDYIGQVKAFMCSDSEINGMLKKASPSLATTPESEQKFRSSLERFLPFIQSLDSNVELNPCQFFACFALLSDAEEGREDVLRSNMLEWAKSGKTYKRYWENRADITPDMVQSCFENALREIDSIKDPMQPPVRRKAPPKRMRDAVWVDYFGESEKGVCQCCEKEISRSKWECAHIVAHKNGGEYAPHNLIPSCKGCNVQMGTENFFDFKKRCGEGMKQAAALLGGGGAQ